MTHARLVRRSRENRDGRAQIYAQLYIRKEKIVIPTGVSATSKEWDKEAQKIKGRSKSVADRNLVLSHLLAKINDIFVRARLRDESVNKVYFLDALEHYDESTDFVAYCRKHLREKEAGYASSTIQHDRTVIDKFAEYCPSVMMSDITPEFLMGYVRFLREKYNNNQTTVRKNFTTLKAHYTAAVREGLAKGDPFKPVKVAQGIPDVVYLTEGELGRLTKLYYSGTLSDNEQETLRFFLFMAFTGLHFGDAQNLNINQIFDGKIHYTRQKTHIQVVVPLSEPAARLVAHYAGGRLRGPLFRELQTNQSFNRLIKEVCKKADIDKAVSAKSGRHTFATLFNSKGGGDPMTLAKLLGHTSTQHLMIYTHITEEMKEKGVSVFNGLM